MVITLASPVSDGGIRIVVPAFDAETCVEAPSVSGGVCVGVSEPGGGSCVDTASESDNGACVGLAPESGNCTSSESGPCVGTMSVSFRESPSTIPSSNALALISASLIEIPSPAATPINRAASTIPIPRPLN